MGLVYSKMKLYHYQDKVDSLPRESGKIMPPIQIRLKPTNVCNHDCRYCAYRVDHLQLGKDMVIKDFIPKEKMLEIVDDIIEMGVKSVTFSGGGEPFCYPYLLDAVKKLSGSPVKFASLTNGTRVTGEVAEIFAHHATWLRISMDGWDDASYMKYRRCADKEFTKIMDNIAEFKKYGGTCYLGVALVVDKDNAPHIFEFTKRMKDAGIESIKIAPCIVSNDGAVNNKYHQPFYDFAKEQAQKAVVELSSAGFEVSDSYHLLDEKFDKDYNWCPYLQICPVIGADQGVYPCHDKAYNIEEALLGSLKNQRFKDFWFSDKNNFFKIVPSKVCGHHCVANANNKMILEYLDVDPNHLEFV